MSAAVEELSDIGRRRLQRRLATGRRSDERWQHILQGAATAFRELGYPATTLDEVARRVGVNRASLYYYVGTKEELLLSLLYEPLLQMTANAKAIAALDLPPDEALTRILRQWAEDMEATPELLLYLSENLSKVLTGSEAEELAANGVDYGHVLSGVIAAGMAAGVFRSDIDASMAMRAVLGMFSSVHQWYVPGGSRTLLEIGETFTELALSSLRPLP